MIGFIAKFWYLNSQHGFANVAGALSVKALYWGQGVSFFRADMVFALVLIPICSLIAQLFLPIRWYSWSIGTAIGIAVMVQILAFAELAILGNLVTAGLLAEGLAWGTGHPMAALEYLLAYNPFSTFSYFVKSVVVVVGATMAILLVCHIIKHRRRAIKKHIYSVATVLWIVCAPLAIASWLPWMRPTVFHSPMFLLAAESLFRSDSGPAEYQGLSMDALRSINHKLANVPDQVSLDPYWGAAKGYDVVFVVMETGPAQILLEDASFKDFPNLKRLNQSAWVGMQHYTTSPESYKAVTSILLSMYPPSHTRSFANKSRRLPGLIQNLRAVGYQTGVYLPNVHGTMYAEREENYYQTLGPDRVFVPNSPPVPKGTSTRWQEQENLDLTALRELEKDFLGSASIGKRFFGIYLPQLSHEPWVDVSAGDDEHNMAKRRYNLMKVEDRHLGELLATIDNLGRLDRTLIVVACDHGLRSSESDSSFRAGQVDDLTFHVPLLLYAPGVVEEQTNLPWVTSHIDISPTILSLLGISENREFEAGTPIWNAGLKDRCIFFFASQYFGADGYHCRGSFSMWNPLLNVTYTGPALHFTASEAVPFDSQSYSDIVTRFQAMDALRNAWYDAATKSPFAMTSSAVPDANK